MNKRKTLGDFLIEEGVKNRYFTYNERRPYGKPSFEKVIYQITDIHATEERGMPCDPDVVVLDILDLESEKGCVLLSEHLDDFVANPKEVQRAKEGLAAKTK